jgi:hypothetical protein
MGLEITVGPLNNDDEGAEYFRRAFARLTKALADSGITWQEPEISGPPAVAAGFPYSFLNHLRRIFVLVRLGEPLTPALETDAEHIERDERKIFDEAAMLDSHLLCHADNSGYYIPVDFDDPLFLPPEADVDGGGIVGSSQRLLAELIGLAPRLGIDLDDEGTLSAAGESELAGLELDAPFGAEVFVWLQLYRACRASVGTGQAIVFH